MTDQLPELATGAQGAEAVGLLLAAIASRTPRAIGPVPPDAGEFADAGLDEDGVAVPDAGERRAPPALADAERAAGHPGSEDALLPPAQLVTHLAGTRRDAVVRRYARALLKAAAAQPADEHPDALRVLRQALVNAGDIDAARV
ncbi:hypothetical protein ABZ372_51860 [Streptomyces sp. NPDC005921]|uniref:hypothetical protein n=1 Tax=Streptomyces sp. NPDC005827 TaxID=3157070 RepID=UPI0033D2348B